MKTSDEIIEIAYKEAEKAGINKYAYALGVLSASYELLLEKLQEITEDLKQWQDILTDGKF